MELQRPTGTSRWSPRGLQGPPDGASETPRDFQMEPQRPPGTSRWSFLFARTAEEDQQGVRNGRQNGGTPGSARNWQIRNCNVMNYNKVKIRFDFVDFGASGAAPTKWAPGTPQGTGKWTTPTKWAPGEPRRTSEAPEMAPERGPSGSAQNWQIRN